MPTTCKRQNVLALRKNGELFMFFFGDEDVEAVIRTLARFAADPELSFTWTDAARLISDMVLVDSPASAIKPGAIKPSAI